MQVNLANTIISTLGNSSSLVPLAIKDTINSTGITYFSYGAGGKLEGKDRFIDEFGTQIIWLLGLPFFKKIANKTFYKAANLNPDVDVRVADSKDHVEFAKTILKNADDEGKNLLKTIENASNRLPMFKGLFYSKFVLATLLTFASYLALTKYKHKATEKAVTKEYLKKKANQEFVQNQAFESKIFNDFNNVAFKGKMPEKNNNKKGNISFKGFSLQSFMFNPVYNLSIVDVGITTERLTKSRTKLEFAEYAIKEGSLLFFMYVAGKGIQSGLEKLSLKHKNVPIDMDLRFINSKEFKEAMKSPENILKEIEIFKQNKSQKEILNYIANNQNSLLVKGAQISDIIGSIEIKKKILGFIPWSKKTDKIDPSAYIDPEKVKGFAESIEQFIEQLKIKNIGTENFIKKARSFKIGAILTGMGACCVSLGYIMPKLMIMYREKHSGSKDFHVAKEVEAKLEQAASSVKI